MKIIDLKQGSPEWLEFRQTHLGASDISAITGTNPWRDSVMLWEEKTGLVERKPPNEAMAHGTETEPLAREAYMSDEGVLLSTPTCVSDMWETAIASLDGITSDLKKIVEFKCPMSDRLYEQALLGQIPPYYMDQIQWQLWVTKAETCDYVVFIDRFKYKKLEVCADLKYQANILNLAEEFWDYVESNTPPPIKSPTVIIDDNLANELASELRKWQAVEKDANERTEYLKSQLKEMFNEDKKYVFSDAQVKMIWSERKGNVDWTKYRKTFQISEESLKEYRKESTKYCTFTMIE